MQLRTPIKIYSTPCKKLRIPTFSMNIASRPQFKDPTNSMQNQKLKRTLENRSRILLFYDYNMFHTTKKLD